MTSYPVFNYRRFLISLCNTCRDAREELFKLGFIISRFGELKDIFELFDEDEELYLPYSLIEDSEHPRIKDILRISQILEEYYSRFSNINALTEPELDEAYVEAKDSEYWAYSEEKPFDNDREASQEMYAFMYSILFSLFEFAYMLSNANPEVPDIDFDPYNEQPELLATMDLDDQNVALIFELMKKIRAVFYGFETCD